MKALKIFFFILIILIGALAAAYFYSGVLLKKGINEAGPKLLGVPISVDNIAADPARGNVEIDQFTIGNPEGFESEYAFDLQSFDFDFVPQSIFDNAIHIRQLSVDGATIISDGLTADNHRAILKSIQSKIPNSQNPSEQPSNETESNGDENKTGTDKGGKKLIIDSFSFTNSVLVVMLDGEEITKVEFPNVQLQQIGTKENALSYAEALFQIYTAIASETTQVLSVNEEVIESIATAKLKKFGIDDLDELKDPEELLKDPEVVGGLLKALTGSDNDD